MDSQNEQGRQEQRDPNQPHHDAPRSSRQSGRGQRPNQGRDQGNRAAGGSPRPGQSEGGGGGGNRGKNRGGSPGQQQEGREGRRRRKEGGDRRGIYGFGDAIERCTCVSYHHVMPEIWPVHSRSNLATLRMVEVDRRPNAILYCDSAHAGPHLWPDGELVDGQLSTPPEQPGAAPAPAMEPVEEPTDVSSS